MSEQTVVLQEEQNATIDLQEEQNATIDLQEEQNATIDLQEEQNATIDLQDEQEEQVQETNEQNVIVDVPSDVVLSPIPENPVVQPVLNNLDNIAADLVIKIIEAIEQKSVNMNNLPTFIFHIMNLVQNAGNLTGVEKKQVVLKVLESVSKKYSFDIDWLLVSNMIDFSVSLANQEVSLGTNDVQKGCLACLRAIFSKKK